MINFLPKRLGVARRFALFVGLSIFAVAGGVAFFGVQALIRINTVIAAGRGTQALQVQNTMAWVTLFTGALVLFLGVVVAVLLSRVGELLSRVGEADARLAEERNKFAALSSQVSQASRNVASPSCSQSTETILKNTCGELERRIRERTSVLEQRTVQLETEIEERQRAQSQLLQSAKMATIGEMASGMTHELNQPMNIIRLGVEAALLKIQRGQGDVAELSKTLRKVESQIIRMSDIVTHMRAYTRIDTQGQAPFDPLLAVRDGCKLFSAQLKGGAVRLNVEAEDYVSPVLGHATRLEQVLLNLLSNARESILAQGLRNGDGAGAAGQITVRVREAQERGVVIEVEDTGGGIPDDVLPHIFAPFVTTKDASSGTGLGLSISFGIVQSMKGTIEVANVSAGARFVLTLPKADETAWLFTNQNAANHAGGTTSSHAGCGESVSGRNAISTILVADDEIGAAQTLADFLQEMGYMVYIAYNGEEALELFDSDPADAVITDMKMPGMGGEELVRRLHARAPDIPIFIMTGGVQDSSEMQNGLPGVTDILYKPFSLSLVAQKLRTLQLARETPAETRNAINA